VPVTAPNTAPPDLQTSSPLTGSPLRAVLARRLVDTVCLPETRIAPQERLIAADLLIELLRNSDENLRANAALRLSTLSEAPSLVLRFLAGDTFGVARPILEDSPALDAFDLIQIANCSTTEHRLIIAGRREVPEPLADTLARFQEPAVIVALLRNRHARFSDATMGILVSFAREHRDIIKTLCRREEMRPSDAAIVFWWADAEDRLYILKRFPPERQVLHEGATDLFARAAAEGMEDGMVRTILQFIERRQRSREALARSPHASLEAAIEAAKPRITRESVPEIAALAGVRPATFAHIALDPGGEALAILCKATGLRKPYMAMLWSRLGRQTSGDCPQAAAYENMLVTYDTISPAKAQTMLRYWNWALTSAAAQGDAAAREPQEDVLAFNPAARAAALVFGHRG
jgi:uncharacterized protein (DUF2336 family)